MVDQNKPSVLVTGGGTGIGAAIARLFAQMSYSVHIAGRRLGPCEGLVDHIREEGGSARAHVLDITESAAVDDLVTRIDKENGGLSVLVANAGIAVSAPFEETSDKTLEEILAINVKGTFACCRAAYRVMKPRGFGSIITIGSVVSHKGYANQAAYAASKHAIRGLSKSLCVEAQPFGVRVACVMPGGVATEMVEKTRPDLDLAHMIQPQDVAEAVRYLVTLPPRVAIDELCLRRWAAAP